MTNSEMFKAQVDGAVRFYKKSGKTQSVNCLKQSFWADKFTAEASEEDRKIIALLIAVSMEDKAAEDVLRAELAAKEEAFYAAAREANAAFGQV